MTRPRDRASAGLATPTALCLPFPLRPGYLAQIVIPRDMTKAEAVRMSEFVMSLVNEKNDDPPPR